MAAPTLHISIIVGEPRPAVFSTALSRTETRRLGAWLAEHPRLDALARLAWEAGDDDPDEPEPSTPPWLLV
jgi:hypothetical protein